MVGFATSEERDKYFLEHAEYFQAARFRGRGQYDKVKAETLPVLEAEVARINTIDPASRPWLVYAIIGGSQAYVKTIKQEGT